jgi:hypothetical protein
MNPPQHQWVCGECQGHGPVWTFHIHRADCIQELAQIPSRCPLCAANAVAVIPISAPVAADAD